MKNKNVKKVIGIIMILCTMFLVDYSSICFK